VSRKIREAKEKAKADALKKRTLDRGRHERDAFAKKLAAVKGGSKTTAPDVIDDDAAPEKEPPPDAG
jgi:hypothetical protein